MNLFFIISLIHCSETSEVPQNITTLEVDRTITKAPKENVKHKKSFLTIFKKDKNLKNEKKESKKEKMKAKLFLKGNGKFKKAETLPAGIQGQVPVTIKMDSPASYIKSQNAPKFVVPPIVTTENSEDNFKHNVVILIKELSKLVKEEWAEAYLEGLKNNITQLLNSETKSYFEVLEKIKEENIDLNDEEKIACLLIEEKEIKNEEILKKTKSLIERELEWLLLIFKQKKVLYEIELNKIKEEKLRNIEQRKLMDSESEMEKDLRILRKEMEEKGIKYEDIFGENESKSKTPEDLVIEYYVIKYILNPNDGSNPNTLKFNGEFVTPDYIPIYKIIEIIKDVEESQQKNSGNIKLVKSNLYNNLRYFFSEYLKQETLYSQNIFNGNKEFYELNKKRLSELEYLLEIYKNERFIAPFYSHFLANLRKFDTLNAVRINSAKLK